MHSSTDSAISTDSNTTGVPSSVAVNGTAGISDDAAPNIPVNKSDSNTTTTYVNESLTNANTSVANNSSNSATTEPGSSLEDVESDVETFDNTTGWGSEGNSSWSNGTTQEKGNGVDDFGGKWFFFGCDEYIQSTYSLRVNECTEAISMEKFCLNPLFSDHSLIH